MSRSDVGQQAARSALASLLAVLVVGSGCGSPTSRARSARCLQAAQPGRFAWTDDLVSAPWSPDGRRIVFASNRVRGCVGFKMDFDLYTASVSGGHARLLVRQPFGRDRFWTNVAWSPRGDAIVYPSRSGIWLVRSDGRHRRRLARVAGADYPLWSPDGSRISFVGGGPLSSYALYVVSARGGRPRRLSHDLDPTLGLAWSPNGKRIAFEAGGRLGVNLVNTRNGHTVRITSLDAQSPAWSPDGRRLAFNVFTPQTAHASVYVVDANGRNLRLIARNSDAPPVWLPHGKLIIESHGLANIVDLQQHSMTPIGPYRYGLSPSPGGTKLVFERVSEPLYPYGNSASGIFVANLTPTGLRRIRRLGLP
jgi:Tol biopolymer transport system component